jgi:hypothetical protein
VAENPKYKLIGQNYVLPDLVALCGQRSDRGRFSRTPATSSMIVASLDAGRRIDEGLVTHV